MADANEYFSKRKIEQKEEIGIAERIASLFPGVPAALILQCQQKSGYNLKNAGISGGSIHQKVKDLSDALKALAIYYQFLHPVIDAITGKVQIIDECHDQQTDLRKIKHTKEKKPSTCAISKVDRLELDRIIIEKIEYAENE